MSECGDQISEEHDVSKQSAEQMLLEMKNRAVERSKTTGTTTGQTLKDIAGEMKASDELMTKIRQRNALLNIAAKRRVKDVARRFPTLGEGILAKLEGTNKNIKGGRDSADANIKAIHQKYFGKMVAALEKENLLRDFKDGTHTRAIYHEMGELKEGGKPGSSGNEKAAKIAKIIDDTTSEMVARQNRAGAYINKIPGYVIRQTHSMEAIRAAGGEGFTKATKDASYQEWKNTVLPLLDKEKTFHGSDPEKYLRKIHEGLYTGIHGAETDESNTIGWAHQGDIARKSSASRILHFKDADSAYQYNEKFGTKDFREAILGDIHQRARSIGLMETLGPTPESNLRSMVREMKEEARGMPDAAKQVDSINERKIQASMNELTGANEISSNPTLSRNISNVKTVMQLSKMGGVFLSKLFGDKAFLQSEMAFQGISHMDTLSKQIGGLAKRSPEGKQMLRLMGVGMDGLIGNSLSRYSSHSSVGDFAHRAQRQFFDMNFLNYWTDVHKSTAGELMAAHLGEHADMPHEQLPDKLKNVLKMYDIGPSQWDAYRSQAWTGETGQKFVTADMVKNVPPGQIDNIVKEKGLNPTDANRAREYDKLESQLRAYFSDRVDIAVPTPGAKERRLVTMDTKAGTALGEAVRLLMLFKSFPITIANKIIGRDVYGNGAMSAKQWLLNDHAGKFNMAQLAAMTTIGGYLSLQLRDLIAGKTPRSIISNGKIDNGVLAESALRGGGMGIMGDMVLNDYDRSYRNFMSQMAGPVLGQLDTAASMMTKLKHGQNTMDEAGKLTLDNTPYINLFYIRPILNYYVLWNLQEMMKPGSMRKMEANAEKHGQHYYVNLPQK